MDYVCMSVRAEDTSGQIRELVSFIELDKFLSGELIRDTVEDTGYDPGPVRITELTLKLVKGSF